MFRVNEHLACVFFQRLFEKFWMTGSHQGAWNFTKAFLPESKTSLSKLASVRLTDAASVAPRSATAPRAARAIALRPIFRGVKSSTRTVENSLTWTSLTDNENGSNCHVIAALFERGRCAAGSVPLRPMSNTTMKPFDGKICCIGAGLRPIRPGLLVAASVGASGHKGCLTVRPLDCRLRWWADYGDDRTQNGSHGDCRRPQPAGVHSPPASSSAAPYGALDFWRQCSGNSLVYSRRTLFAQQRGRTLVMHDTTCCRGSTHGTAIRSRSTSPGSTRSALFLPLPVRPCTTLASPA
jgi:hypothetical protein